MEEYVKLSLVFNDNNRSKVIDFCYLKGVFEAHLKFSTDGTILACYQKELNKIIVVEINQTIPDDIKNIIKKFKAKKYMF